MLVAASFFLFILLSPLIKGLSWVVLMFYIALFSWMIMAQVVRSQTGSTLLPFATILILYFALSLMISFGMRRLERRMTRGLDGVR